MTDKTIGTIIANLGIVGMLIFLLWVISKI